MKEMTADGVWMDLERGESRLLLETESELLTERGR